MIPLSARTDLVRLLARRGLAILGRKYWIWHDAGQFLRTLPGPMFSAGQRSQARDWRFRNGEWFVEGSGAVSRRVGLGGMRRMVGLAGSEDSQLVDRALSSLRVGC